jgi:hypothetical protein
MRNDDLRPVVKGVAVVIIQESNEFSDKDWNVYLLNKNDFPINNILITSKGYGIINNESRKSSTIRQFIDYLDAKSYVKIEPIAEEVFGLSNEYWVSYYVDNVIYDKKFIFLPDSILEKNMTDVPLMKTKGVVIE